LRTAADNAAKTLAGLTGQQTAATERHAALLQAAEQERQKAATHGKSVVELDRMIGLLTAECERRRGEIQKADQAADLHGRLKLERAKSFASDLDDQFALAESAVTEAQAARDALPHLEVILRSRAAHHKATADASSAKDAATAAADEATRLQAAEREAADFAVAEATRAETARQAAALAVAQLEQARDQLSQFGSVAGEAVCSRCRQPIGPEHVERERRELEQAIRDAQAKCDEPRRQAESATEAAGAAQRAKQQREAERRRAETARDNAARDHSAAVTTANGARTTFDNALAELSRDLAERIVAIDVEGFPTRADLDHARETARQVDNRTRTCNELRRQCQDRDATAKAIATLEQAVTAVGAPTDVTEARAQLISDAGRLADWNRDRGEADQGRLKAEQAERDLLPHIRNALEEVNRLAGDVGRADADARTARRAFDEAVQALPDGALGWDGKALADELQQLEAADFERDFEAMAEDRALQVERQRRLTDAERQIEQEVPADARRPSAEVQQMVTVAEQAVRDAERQREAARDALAEFDRQRVRRADMRQRLADAERNHAMHDRLAGLLGPQGIQLDLVRHAERRIIDLANETLGRVSRGELRFDPPDPMATQPLDLSVRRAGCPDPISVGNLSSGQWCRVAVSLALAVCRFACGEAQPLQSVIIDEAFANLDRDGRMATIDVIRDGRIAGHVLQRIIVVSHHEDVAAAFPLGYRLENRDGTTHATAFGC
jgi:DNA repair exonuclease SbcCD ATPase subunit